MLLGSKNITVILSSLQPQQRLLIWHRVVPLDTFQATNRFVVPAPHCRHLVGGPLYSIASAVLGPGPLSPAGHTSHANWVQMRQEWVPDCSPGRCPPLGGRRVVATQKRASCQPPPYTNSVSSGVPLPCGGKVVVAGLAHPFGSGFWHACGAPGLRCLVGPRTILPRSAAGDPPLPNVAQFCRKLCHRGGAWIPRIGVWPWEPALHRCTRRHGGRLWQKPGRLVEVPPLAGSDDGAAEGGLG